MSRFHSTYFPSPGCVAEELTVVSPSTPTGALPGIAAARFILQASYFDLFFRRGHIKRISVEGLDVQFSSLSSSSSQAAANRKEDGPPTVVDEMSTKNAVLEVARADGREPLRFDIHEMVLHGVRHDGPFSYQLAMRNAVPPGEIVAHGRFGPWNSSNPGQTALSGSYSFQKADLSVFNGIAGVLSSEGSFEGVLGEINAQGNTDIPDFEVTRNKHKVHLKTRYEAVVDGTNGDTFLKRVEGSFGQTTALVKGSIADKRGVDGKFTALDATVHQGRIEDVLRMFVKEKNAPMEGVTTFKTHIVLPPGHGSFLEKINLEADFTITNGRMTSAERQASVDMLSKRALGKIKEKRTESVTLNLAGHVALRNKKANFTDSHLTVPGADAAMGGVYELATERIDFHGTLKTQAEVSETSKGIKHILLEPLDPLFKRKHAGASVPVAMTGTYHDAHFGFEILPKGKKREKSRPVESANNKNQ